MMSFEYEEQDTARQRNIPLLRCPNVKEGEKCNYLVKRKYEEGVLKGCSFNPLDDIEYMCFCRYITERKENRVPSWLSNIGL